MAKSRSAACARRLWVLAGATLLLCSISTPSTRASHGPPAPLFSVTEYLAETVDTGVSPGVPVETVLGALDAEPGIDMAVVLRQDSNVAVLLNTGHGLLGDPHLYRTGREPRHLALGDVDGDGDNDLAVSNYGDSTVSVLLNRGDGTFVDATSGAASYSLPFTSPQGLAVGDIDGDGHQDLAVASGAATGLAVLLNRGDGTFRPAVAHPAGGYAVAIRDLDNDGDNDLVTSDATVLLNDGHGGFGVPTTYLAGWISFGIAVADVDGDGDLDIAGSDLTSSRLSVLLNAGDGTFPESTSYPIGAGPMSLVFADFDGDHRSDLVVANSRHNDVWVLTNDGAGGFLPGVPYGTDREPFNVAAGDVDGDGTADVVVTSTVCDASFCYEGSVGVMLNQGDGTLESRRVVAGDQPVSIASGDLDGDGDQDLAVVNSASSDVMLFLNHGDAVFSPGPLLRLGFARPNPPPKVYIKDIDGDGDLDVLVAAGRFPYFSIFRNSGRARFGPDEVLTSALGRARDLVATDIDLDHDTDIVVLSGSTFEESRGVVAVHSNSGDSSFSGPPVTYPALDGPRALASCDLNGDSYPDLVTANTALRDIDGDGRPDTVGSVVRLLNNGDGTFAAAVEQIVAGTPSFVAAVDLNGDHACDVAVTDSSGAAVLVLFNRADGSGAFGAPTRYRVGALPASIVIGDFDGNGTPDLGVANQHWGDETASVLLNDGAGVFTNAGAYRSGDAPLEDIWIGRPLAAADLDGDGDLDLAIANGADDDVSILLNRSVRPEAVAGDTPGGGTFTSDFEEDGATSTDPVETTLTTPIGGGVSISEGPITTEPPGGFVFFGQQVDVVTPPVGPDPPLVIAFDLDASRVPAGYDEHSVAVFRNGAFVPNCTGAPATAAPDPCVSARERMPDGDLRLTVFTSEASVWNFGVYRLDVPVELLVHIDGDIFGPDLVRVLFPTWRYRLFVNSAKDTDQDGKDELWGVILPFTALGSTGQLGAVVVRLRDAQIPPTSVELEEQSNKMPQVLELFPFGPAAAGTSLQQLLLEFEFVHLKLLLHNLTPLGLGGGITQWPPRIGEDLQLVGAPVPLFDQNDKPAGVKILSVTARFGRKVAIKVKPGAQNPTINPDKHGALPVAILSSADFSASTEVDRSSLGFGRTGEEYSLTRKGKAGAAACDSGDVNADGLADLVCRFRVEETGIRQGDVQAFLSGRTVEGLPIGGAAAIRTLKPPTTK